MPFDQGNHLTLLVVIFLYHANELICISADCLKQLSQILVLIKKKKKRCLHRLSKRGYILVNKRANIDRHMCIEGEREYCLHHSNQYKQDQITLCSSQLSLPRSKMRQQTNISTYSFSYTFIILFSFILVDD